MSDSNQERRHRCERCHQWREGVSYPDWTCSECRLRERCDELERENAALREQLVIAKEAKRDACYLLAVGSQERDAALRQAARWRRLLDWVREIAQWLRAEQETLEAVSLGEIDRKVEARRERDAALCRASEVTQECGRLEARLEHATALIHECREWLNAGGASSRTRTGYIEFHQRLDAACGDGPTLWHDQRPKERTHRRKES